MKIKNIQSLLRLNNAQNSKSNFVHCSENAYFIVECKQNFKKNIDKMLKMVYY